MRGGEVTSAGQELSPDGVEVMGVPAVDGQDLGGEPLAFRPPTGRQQLPGQVVRDVAADGVLQAELAARR